MKPALKTGVVLAAAYLVTVTTAFLLAVGILVMMEPHGVGSATRTLEFILIAVALECLLSLAVAIIVVFRSKLVLWEQIVFVVVYGVGMLLPTYVGMGLVFMLALNS